MRKAVHPWNTGFVWSDHTGGLESISAEQARRFDDDGFFVLEDAFDAPMLQRLDAELAPGDERARRFLSGVPDGRFGVTALDSQIVAPHAVTRSDFVRGFVADPVFVNLARDLIGPDVRLYWDQSVYKQPNGSEPVLWHQDNGYTYVEPQAYLTCWIAITDATPENGCIAVMPGAHRDGTLEHRSTAVGEECWGDWSEAVEVPVTAGSIVVFTSLTPHATKRNTTNEVRKAYIVQYAPDGAIAHFGDPGAGPPVRTQMLGDDARQFWIVRDGVAAAPTRISR
jgi:Phytanoyl-CoA dioxygenase (PhyH)